VALIRRRNAFQTGAARALTTALTDWPHWPGPSAEPADDAERDSAVTADDKYELS